MAIEEEALTGLYVGAAHTVRMTVYQSDGKTPQDVTGWTIVLDIRRDDTSEEPAKLSKTATLVTPLTGIVEFALSKADMSASIFPGNEFEGRHSVWRTDTGSEQPLRYGNVTITRTTQV